MATQGGVLRHVLKLVKRYPCEGQTIEYFYFSSDITSCDRETGRIGVAKYEPPRL